LTVNSSKAPKGLAFAHVAVMLAVLTGVYLIAVMLATRFGYLSPDLGFRTLTLGYGPKIALGTLAISILSLLISLFMSPGRLAFWALAAVLVSGGFVGGFFAFQKALKAFPPIADVATDWDNPLAFSDKLMASRGTDALRVEDLPRVPRNESMAWGGKTVADINQLTCPTAKPVFNKAVTATQIVDLLKAENYSIVSRTPEQVEATYTDFLYGFRSDVVVRMQNHRVDIRSVGRYDIPDLGDNCRRVSRLVKLIKAM
jgi:uncharacterized protein (DUF1499 family)